ncbi:hypothetical protein [Rhizobium sp. P38BS-XIX]|uniref:DUF6894 family protein n=1 Tax=Rhizobium sp. P38BS-XIX TaxID=2726740 RepID=UPI00145671EE|nr:hypothetical protein [Rhizobium sp. P38BS-XIX]
MSFGIAPAAFAVNVETEAAPMTRYFFHIRRNGETVPDREGDEFASVDDARVSALRAVQELVAASIKNGQIVPDEYIDVQNDANEPQFSISFHDVVRDHLK